MKKVYSLLIAFLSLCLLANAQSQLGEIRGKVIDGKTKQPMGFVSVTVLLNGIQKASTMTDEDGNYMIKTLPPGEYVIKATYTGYDPFSVTEVEVTSDNITFQNINMESAGTDLKVHVVKRTKPLVDPTGKGGGAFTGKDLMARPSRGINAAVGVVAGVDSRNGGTPNIRGARADGTAYYVDGIRVNGSTGLPQFAIDQLEVITGGIPAQYGDFVGGAITVNTKAPTKNFVRSFEYRTSSPFYGYLDNSQYNQLQAYVSGPLKVINKDKGDKERVVIGFTLGGTGTYSRDPSLPATDIYKVKDNVLRDIQSKPLTRNATGGFVNSAEYVTKNDLEKIGYKQNAALNNIDMSGGFVFAPANNMTVKVGLYGNYSRNRNYSYTNSLFNSDNNLLITRYTVRPYVQFTQAFSKKEGKDKDNTNKAFVSDAFYTVRLAYERAYVQQENADFGDNFFKYGYVGKFSTYSMANYTRVSKPFGASPDKIAYWNEKTQKVDTLYLNNYVKQEYERTDTLVQFSQADINTIKGNYTKTIFDYYNQNNIPVQNISMITGNGGLNNGVEPTAVYSNMWQNVGANQAIYGKSQVETYSLYVMSQASVGNNPKAKHDLQFGFTYEQQFQRSYSLVTTSNGGGLWGLMRQLTNMQFAGNNTDSLATVSFDANGVFQDTVRYSPKILDDKQSNFDKNLRAKLMQMGATDVYGKPITNTSRIDVNLYDPSMYSLKLFSADELLNDGNSLISYNGYDYLGNSVSGKQSVDKFLNDKQNRPIGAFAPIYMAAWAQDQFVFKDLIVRVGVRMERYDANQIVLKDPYSLAPIHTAGDVRRNDALNIASTIPSNIGDDYAVYIDTENPVKDQTHILGYRQGNNWYDASGNPVTDPQSISKNASKISRNTPYLVNPGQKLPDASSFKDYTPDVKFLPRVWFSFPISTTAQFFGTYDVLAQRPSLNNAQIDDYYYMKNRQSNGPIANPDLKMAQVTAYEIGFRQQIGSNSSLGIIAAYREYRNLMQQYRYVQAWPYDYTTYGNLDFSTMKSIQLEYMLRDLGNITLSANYTLQFADGTGSNANSSSALIQSGLAQQRNIFPVDFDTRHAVKGVIDYHYKDGKDYNGPIVGGKKIFERAGINLVFNAVSGRPYTEIKVPVTTTQDGVATRSQVKGTINGAYLPAQFYTDLNVDKYFLLKSEGLDNKLSVYTVRIYLEIQNLFNAANVLSVYQYTGSAYDDGYLASPQAKAAIQSATNAQSFVDLYNVKMMNPNNFATPRLTRLGVALIF